MIRAFVLFICLVPAATGAYAQSSEPEVAGGSASIESTGAGVPTGTSGEITGAGSGAMTNGQSARGDRRMLDDLKAGTFGSTQTR